MQGKTDSGWSFLSAADRPRFIRELSLTLLLVGFVLRVIPLFDADGRLLYQWPTEDGYLTLQIARNMALGHGMSVSGGSIPTNGTQPLATFLWSLLYGVVDGNKTTGVLAVLLLEIVVSLATAALIFVVGRRWFAHRDNGPWIALVAAACWFASPVSIPHSMNCLETGVYGLLVSFCLWLHGRGTSHGSWSLSKTLGFGVALGAVFWARNDGVFVILGFTVSHWLVGVRKHAQALLGTSFRETLIMGSVSVVVATPWLYNNYSSFGHLMPISGVAESYGAKFGGNLYLVPTVLFEYVSVILPIPNRLDGSPIAFLTAGALAAVPLFLMARGIRTQQQFQRTEIFAICIYGGCLALFYGFYFGAPHFMNRYLYPVSPALALGTTALVFSLEQKLRSPATGRALVSAAVASSLLLSLGLGARQYMKGPHHEHRQVVEWTAANVADDVWVGAVQTGTLGYFHDRTYNLDGKVNPEALEAKLRREIPQYIVDKNIRYVIDWAGIAHFAQLPPVDKHFVVDVEDKKKNLAVLRRID